MQNTCNFFVHHLLTHNFYFKAHVSFLRSFILPLQFRVLCKFTVYTIDWVFLPSFREMRWNAYVGGWFGFVNQVEFGIRRKGSFLWRWWWWWCVRGMGCVEGGGRMGGVLMQYIDIFITLRTLVYMVGIMDTDVSFGH